MTGEVKTRMRVEGKDSGIRIEGNMKEEGREERRERRRDNTVTGEVRGSMNGREG